MYFLLQDLLPVLFVCGTFTLYGRHLLPFLFPGISFRPSTQIALAFFCGIPLGTIVFCPFFFIFSGSGVKWVLGSALVLPGIYEFFRSKMNGDVESKEEVPSAVTYFHFFFICLALIFALLPHWNLGGLTDSGYAFRAYFSADYLKHIAITEELSKFSFPPENPYFSPNELHYYWLFYIIPAVGVVLGGSAQNVLLVYHFILNVSFLLLLTFFINSYARQSITRLLVYVMLIFATSFEGVYVFYKFWNGAESLIPFVSRFNIDAVTRWYIGHPQFDSLYRTLIYTPQHLVSLALMLVMLLSIKAKRTARGYSEHFFLGFLAISSFLWSAIIGFVVVIWFTFVKLIAYLRHPFSLKNFLFSSVAGLPILALLGIALSIRMIVPGGSPLEFVVLPAESISLILLFNFGLLLILACGALFFRRYWMDCWQEFLLLMITLIFGLFVQIQDFPSDIGLKAGLIIIVTLSIPACFFMDAIVSAIKSRKVPYFIFLIALILLMGVSVPTVLIDVYNSQDIENRQFTTYVHRDEMEACHWIRENIPSDDMVQSETNARGNFFSLIPTFAGRRVSTGDTMHSHIFQTRRADYLKRNAQVYDAFSSFNVYKLMKISDELKIDHYFWGVTEKQLFLPGFDKFTLTISVLPQIYKNNSVSIFSLHERWDKLMYVRADTIDEESFQLTIVNPNQKISLLYDITKNGMQNETGNFEKIAPLSTLQKKLDPHAGYSGSLLQQSLLLSAKVHKRYKAQDFKTQIGTITQSEDRAIIVAEPGKEGFLIYGPYHYFPPGSYSVTFLLSAQSDSTIGGETIGFVDVYAIDLKKVFAHQDLKVNNEMQTISLSVDLPQTTKLEFRVFSSGKVHFNVSEVMIDGTEEPISIPMTTFITLDTRED